MERLRVNRLDTSSADFQNRLEGLLRTGISDNQTNLANLVSAIISDVEARGDSALLEYAARLDNRKASTLKELTLEPKDFRAALQRIATEDRRALESAAERIRAYHMHQKPDAWSYQDALGNSLGQRVTPLKRVGFCIPGGQASYPSSVLMTVIPAVLAGVEERVMVSPLTQDYNHDMVLAAAAVAGLDLAYCVGGAHAVAALACGTQSIARVDKIVGPGGLYVSEAKRQVFGRVGIDMIAGPSEVLIISDGHAEASTLALDLMAQAEHDSSSQALLLSPDERHLDRVEQALAELLFDLPRKNLIRQSLENRGGLILCRSLVEAADLANRLAPEHLELALAEPAQLLPRIDNAGAIFLGASPEVMGDYNAGPSHCLPTQGTARFASPLGVYDFVKRSSVIALSDRGLRQLAAPAARLARREGLEAHARSAEARLIRSES